MYRGTRGVILNTTDGLTVDVDDLEEPVTYRPDELGDNGLPESLDWGYASTIHKAQGSEFSHVIVIVSENMTWIGKPGLYTAISRAKRELTVIGDLAAIPGIVAASGWKERTTVLGALLSKPRPAVAQVSAADRLAEFLRRQDVAARLAAMPEHAAGEPEDDFAELDMS